MRHRLPTDRKLLQLTPDEFFDAIVVAELRAKGIVEGPNFCFGKDRKGDIGTLRDLCRQRGVAAGGRRAGRRFALEWSHRAPFAR